MDLTPNLTKAVVGVALVILLALGTNGETAAAAYARKRVSACEYQLSPEQILANRERIKAIYAEGAETDGPAAVFAGVSREDLVELAALGDVPTAITRHVPHLIESNVDVQDYRRRFRAREFGFDLGESAWDLAVRHARARAHARLVLSRLDELRSAEPAVVVEKLVPILSLLPVDEASGPTFTPRFRQIVEAAETAKGTRGRDPVWPYTHELARELGVAWTSINEEISPAREKLRHALGGLPRRAGIVLALNASALPKVALTQDYLPALRTLDLDDVFAIEPLTAADLEFMNTFERAPETETKPIAKRLTARKRRP